jgi:uncharacterized protein YjbI with pentapeptide repeats
MAHRWWRRARVAELTQRELDALSVENRLELLGQSRADRHQTLNSMGILFGVVFTLAGLIATWLSLHSAQGGQIADRYSRSTEQLSSPDPAVRLSAIYALKRLMDDSPRDQRSVVQVLTGYVRLHAQDRASGPSTDKANLAVDVRAALGVIHTRQRKQTDCGRCNFEVDLSHVSFRGKNLVELDLSGMNLGGADLGGSDLTYVNLSGTRLNGANLAGVNLTLLVGRDPTFEALDGVVWSKTTQWPASMGGTTGMRARSVEFKKGFYRVVDRGASSSAPETPPDTWPAPDAGWPPLRSGTGPAERSTVERA